jgi:YD repeat-containing protein
MFTYDGMGNLTSMTDRKAQTHTFTYDVLNCMTQETTPHTTPCLYLRQSQHPHGAWHG